MSYDYDSDNGSSFSFKVMHDEVGFHSIKNDMEGNLSDLTKDLIKVHGATVLVLKDLDTSSFLHDHFYFGFNKDSCDNKSLRGVYSVKKKEDRYYLDEDRTERSMKKTINVASSFIPFRSDDIVRWSHGLRHYVGLSYKGINDFLLTCPRAKYYAKVVMDKDLNFQTFSRWM